MNEQQLRDYEGLPAAQGWRRIDFDGAEIVTLESHPPQYVLVVRGIKPYLNMEVDLVPLVYVRRPEYWGIEVVGALRGIGLPATAPYTVSIRLAGITGTAGIQIIGATRSETREVPPMEEPTGECSNWNAVHDHMPPGPARLRVRGECTFPTGGYTVALRRHEPQGINPADLLLDRVVDEPSGPVPQVITVVPVEYREETDVDYKTVTILPDGASVAVQDVH